MKLSIIIPVYQVEAYVAKCITSCLSQRDVNLLDYEIIIVNDGTKDRSMDIVNQLISPDCQPPIKIINQENKGLSEARNTGLRYATGEYVWFVDSDDYIEPDSVASIIATIEANKVDVIQMPYRILYENSNRTEIESVVTICNPIIGKKCMDITRFPNLAQSRVIRTSFLKDNRIVFRPHILHEDAELKPRLLYAAKSVVTLNKLLYNYLKRASNSITSSFTKRNAEGRWEGVKSMYEYSKELPTTDRKLFIPDMNFNMYFIITGLNKLAPDDRHQIIRDIINNRHIFKLMKHTLSPKKLLVYSMLYYSPKIFFKLLST
ncbi:MAG: glycosyltransferase [Bacteroides sp.]|nr:glycosyltransferase [Bacteroides sp.]